MKRPWLLEFGRLENQAGYELMKRLGKASSTYTFGQKYRIREERYDSHLDSDYMGLFETSMLEDGVGVLSSLY